MKKKTKTILFSVSSFIILITIPIILIFFSSAYFLSDQYGMTTISVGGKQIYFKREARGLNYDRIILSPDNDYCADYNPDTDFNFSGMDDIIYYKINDEILQLISSTTIQPQKFPVKVEVQEVYDPFMWIKLKNKHRENGIEFLEVPLDDAMWCY